MARKTKRRTPKDALEPSFHRFQKLPPELRLMVWNYLLTSPQIVDVVDGFWRNRPKRIYPSVARKLFYRTGFCIPTLLRACNESRQLVLSKYTLTMYQYLDGNREQIGTWLNLRADVVYVRALCLLQMFRKELAEMRYLAIPIELTHLSEYDFIPLLKELSRFPQLKELTFCLHAHDCAYDVADRKHAHLQFIEPAKERNYQFNDYNGGDAPWQLASVVIMREFELDMAWYAKKYSRELKALKVKIKVMTVGRWGRCCGPNIRNSRFRPVARPYHPIPLSYIKTRLLPEEN